MEPIVSRFKQFLEEKKLSVPQLSALLGYASPERLYRLLRQSGAKPSVDFLEDVAKVFPELNMDWLIRGLGDMLKEKTGELPVDKLVLIEIKESELNKLQTSLKLVEKAVQAPVQVTPIQQIPLLNFQAQKEGKGKGKSPSKDN